MTPEEKLDQIAIIWEAITHTDFPHDMEMEYTKDFWKKFVLDTKPTADEIYNAIKLHLGENRRRNPRMGLIDLENALKDYRAKSCIEKKHQEIEKVQKNTKLREKSLQKAIENGIISKPERCSVCGSERLHYNYDPQDIYEGTWNCTDCMLHNIKHLGKNNE